MRNLVSDNTTMPVERIAWWLADDGPYISSGTPPPSPTARALYWREPDLWRREGGLTAELSVTAVFSTVLSEPYADDTAHHLRLWNAPAELHARLHQAQVLHRPTGPLAVQVWSPPAVDGQRRYTALFGLIAAPQAEINTRPNADGNWPLTVSGRVRSRVFTGLQGQSTGPSCLMQLGEQRLDQMLP